MRAFWPLAALTLAIAGLFALSALWVTFNPASGCNVDGQACSSFGIGALALFIGGPTLLLMSLVLAGARIRRHHPRMALALVAAPPVLIAMFVLYKILASAAP